nr:porin family protein [uncultured Psychroserpens sp.]
MDTKKDIGAALKHRLEDFKSSPDDLVWNHIEVQLKKKKKKRFFILLFSGLGLSAILLLLYINNPLQHTIENEVPKMNTVISDFTNEIATNKNSNTTESNTSKTDYNNENDTLHPFQKLDTNQKTTPIATQERQASSIKNKIANHNKNVIIQQQNTIRSNPHLKDDTRVDLDHTENNTSDKTNSLITHLTTEKITRKDSLITSHSTENQQDSIPKQEALTKLVSEEKEKDSIQQNNSSRWSVTPQAILSYYGALSSKSNANFSLNYGLLLSYRVTDDTFLRIGVKKLDLKQSIDGFDINTNYLEFPLDIKYTPFDKKLNPYFTGGISYFVLQDATINNQNNSNYKSTYSLHVGLGFEYKLIKNFYLNLESNFNYQIKPILQNNTINPFILSINTGIEYKF